MVPTGSTGASTPSAGTTTRLGPQPADEVGGMATGLERGPVPALGLLLWLVLGAVVRGVVGAAPGLWAYVEPTA